LWRKRFGRHVRDCVHCGRLVGDLVAPQRLLFGIGLLPLSATALTLDLARTAPLTPAGFVLPAVVQGRAVAAAVVLAVTAGGGLTYAVHYTPAVPSEVRSGIAAASAAPSASGPVSGSAAASAGARVATGVTAADIFVAPDGSDAGDGSERQPFRTIAKASAAVRAGQTIALRGGVYRPTDGIALYINGTPQQRITLSNYRDEHPTIDAAAIPAGTAAITHRANHWTVQGIEIMNSRSHAYVCRSCQDNILRRLSIHDSVRAGLTLRDADTVGNQILDSDFYRNYDPSEPGTAGIGVGIKFGTGAGNVIRGCRAFDNAAAGFDVGFFDGAVLLTQNRSYGNGVNRWGAPQWRSEADGFLLGGDEPAPAAPHVLRDNAAWDNAGDGFDAHGNPGRLDLARNTAFRNGGTGFRLSPAAPVPRDNASVDNGAADGGAAGRFRSLDPTLAQGPRAADGTLPRSDFLVPDGDGPGARMG
jgi:hypothetical protein